MTDTAIKDKLIDIKLRWIRNRYVFRKLSQNRLGSEDDLDWITVNGARIPLKNGEPQNEAARNIFEESYSPEVHELLGTEHKGVKGAAAIDKLLEEQSGHVKNAFNKKGIGYIDVIWGDDSVGLRHIIKRRNEEGFDGESFLYEIPNVIRNGRVRARNDGRFEISHHDTVVVISPNLKNDAVTFLLTAYE